MNVKTQITQPTLFIRASPARVLPSNPGTHHPDTLQSAVLVAGVLARGPPLHAWAPTLHIKHYIIKTLRT